MGQLVQGRWEEGWYDTAKSGGRFIRESAQFRDRITAGPGPFQAEPGRYHLYVSPACPWAHRTLITRALKGLQDQITLTYLYAFDTTKGWSFDPDDADRLPGDRDRKYAFEVYIATDPEYTGRVSVPFIFDKKSGKVVNNESSEIIRMLNSEFDSVGAIPGDYYPEALRPEIDSLNARIYETVNNGVYRAGFATSQAAYEDAVVPLFETLDFLENRLEGRAWLVGDILTEADIRLFPTLLRFDLVYYSHFKCNIRQIRSYPNLWNLTKRIYALPGVRETVDLQKIKRHYYFSNKTINPTGIVPMGPHLDLES